MHCHERNKYKIIESFLNFRLRATKFVEYKEQKLIKIKKYFLILSCNSYFFRRFKRFKNVDIINKLDFVPLISGKITREYFFYLTSSREFTKYTFPVQMKIDPGNLISRSKFLRNSRFPFYISRESGIPE